MLLNFKTKHKQEDNMETKSRYEVIADLEEKKRNLIMQRNNLDSGLKASERQLKEMKRELEDKEEDIKDYKNSMSSQKETMNELIKSVDESLNRLSKLNEKKS